MSPLFRRRRRPLHLLHIGKTGGTAVRTALGKRVVEHGHDFVLPDLPVGEQCIFFVRDPVTRFVSAFYSRQRQGRPLTFHPWTEGEEKAFTRFDGPADLAHALAEGDEDAREAMSAIRHVREPLAKWLIDETYLRSRLGDVFFVGSQEHLDDDFARLKELLGLPRRVRLPKDDVKAHRNPRGLDYTLDDAAVESVRTWYAGDYALLDVLAGAFPNLPRY
jgi:sulfotransferase famil protein